MHWYNQERGPVPKQSDQFKREVLFTLIDLSSDLNSRKMNKLFAIDTETQEVIVSESPKGSKAIHFIERVAKKDNAELYDSVVKLSDMARAADFDMKEFKALDKICQGLYRKYKKID